MNTLEEKIREPVLPGFPDDMLIHVIDRLKGIYGGEKNYLAMNKRDLEEATNLYGLAAESVHKIICEANIRINNGSLSM